MPVPIRDDGSAGPTKRLIVFVHGFNSTAAGCWEPLLHRIRHDPRMTNAFDCECFGYETSLFRFAPLRRLPRLTEIANELGDYLDRKLFDSEMQREQYIDTTLVGHSMGGLVIQAYLLQRLHAGRGRDLDRIRQVIQFATPNFGSDTLKTLRTLASLVVSNPQEEALRTFSIEIDQIQRGIRDKVIHAHARRDHSYPLPFYCFWGDSDNVVPEASALGYFHHGAALRGDHFTLHKPLPAPQSDNLDDNCDQSWQAFVDALLYPHGHPHIWEVDSFLYSARVSPLPSGTIIQATHGAKRRPVVTDNSAVVTRKIRFARNNSCFHPFPLRYATRNGGWIQPEWPDHITSPEKLRQYDDTGTEVIAEVAPDQTPVSTLTMRVYGGFEVGHRDYHMHVGRKAYFRRLEFVVDLQDYIASGWRVTRGPFLYFHLQDQEDHKLCGQREMLDPDPPDEYDPKGAWRWTFEHVKDGVVDISWDLAPPGFSIVRPTPSVIELHSGQHAVFGYGSLLSIASLEKTLGRRYDGPFLPCDLIGWHRVWDIAMPNSTWCYTRRDGSLITPEKILYLNIAPQQGRRINGVLFVVSDEELRNFDDREWIYERIQVQAELRSVTVAKGTAWAYVGKPEHRISHFSGPSQIALRQSYLDIIHTGLSDLGTDFASAYHASTDPFPAPLVIHDQRHELPLTSST